MLKRILVPLDGTPLGEAILPQVAELARALGATIELIHVVPPHYARSAGAAPRERPSQMIGAPAVLPQLSPSASVLRYRIDPDEVAETRRYVERVAAWLTAEGLDVEPTVVEGADVATEVLRRLAHADLLALAAHAEPGGSRIGRLVFGSISERLIHECYKPVLLLRVPNATG